MYERKKHHLRDFHLRSSRQAQDPWCLCQQREDTNVTICQSGHVFTNKNKLLHGTIQASHIPGCRPLWAQYDQAGSRPAFIP